ncbi:MAG: hypothetical protein KatS3mg050_5035 [Litorilinea sp.]|nr:MAG: hypothetical protein KatS3mg050_5035 [Litorilinea sp.]
MITGEREEGMDEQWRKIPLRRYSFILSLWTESSPYAHGPPVWRFSLTDGLTSQRWGFTDLTDLMRFLRQHMKEGMPDNPENEE